MEKLTFETFRVANLKRCEESFHPLCSWSPADWACALGGECGEALNFIKKLRRLEGKSWKDRRVLVEAVAKELGDIVTYTDLLAARLEINLGAAIINKFNEVSDRVGSTIKLA